MTRFPQFALPTLPRLPALAWPNDVLLGMGPPEPPPVAVPEPEPVITPEEEGSLLRSLMGGAAYVGESLDKPGAAVRGLLTTGDLGQLAHAIPFSETLGFAPKKKVSGRRMLQKAGLLGPNKPGFDLGDVAGFAAEVATDPLMLLTIGPLAKGAAAATKGVKSLEAASAALKATRASVAAGKLTGLGRALKTPAGIAAQIRAGERGVWGLRVPFAAEPFATFGEGSKVGAWALEKMAYGGGQLNPLVWMRGIFSHSAAAKNLSEFLMRNPGKLQRAKDLGFAERQLLNDTMVDLGTALARKEPELMTQFTKIAEHHEKLGDLNSFNAFIRSGLEAKNGLPKAEDMLSNLRKHLDIPPSAPLDGIVTDANKMAEDFYTYAESLQQMQDATYARMEALGMPLNWLDDLYGAHSARRPSEVVRKALTKVGARERIDAGYKWWMGRRWRDIPGMTRTLNAATRDPLVTGVRDYAAAGKALFSEKELAEITGRGGQITAEMGRKRFTQRLQQELRRLGVAAEEMPEKISDLQSRRVWKEHIAQPFEEFWQVAQVDQTGQLIDDAGELVLKRGQPVSRQSELMEWWGSEAVGKAPVLPGVPGAPLAKVGQPTLKLGKPRIERLVNQLRRLPAEVREKGIFDRRPLEDTLDYMKSVLEWESNLRSMHNFLGQKGVVARGAEKPDWLPLQEVWRGISTGRRKRGLTPEGLETFARSIGAQAGDDLRVSPGTANILQNYIDIGKPKFKAEWQRIADAINKPFRTLYFMVWPASHVRNFGGGFFNSWSAGRVNFGELTQGNWAAINYLRGKGALQSEHLFDQILKGVGRDLEIGATEGTLGGIPKWATKAGAATPTQVISPKSFQGLWAIPGKAAKGVTNLGTEAYNSVEFVNRMGYAEALAKKGFADSEIVNLVNEAQFNYALASPFEREYVQRGVLFWKWPRNNLPFTLANIVQRPGGRTAQTLRAMRVARGDEEEYTPEMLREGLGVRTGGTEQAAHFLRQSGVPPEDLNRIVLEGGLPSGRTLERAASTLHPLALAPLELASGRQFYSGRKIRDLWSPTEAMGYELPFIDRLIHYSPLSRVAQEARGIVDRRKTVLQRGLNALTGFKTSTYDLESLREQDLRRAIERELKRMPDVSEVTIPFVPKAKQEKVRPEAKKKLKQLQAVIKRIRNLREERAAREK